jgi:hypothetical protein
MIEDRLKELLRAAPPELSGIDPLSLRPVLVRHRRRRRAGFTLAGLALAAAVVTTGIVALPIGSNSRTQSVSVTGQPTLQLSGWELATVSGTLEDGVTSFEPPASDQPAVSPQTALEVSLSNVVVKDPETAEAVLAHLTAAKIGAPTDAWLVVLSGGCVPQPNSIQHATAASGTRRDDPAGQCLAEPATGVVDAQTGQFLFAFSGGEPTDPAQLLAPGSQ